MTIISAKNLNTILDFNNDLKIVTDYIESQSDIQSVTVNTYKDDVSCDKGRFYRELSMVITKTNRAEIVFELNSRKRNNFKVSHRRDDPIGKYGIVSYNGYDLVINDFDDSFYADLSNDKTGKLTDLTNELLDELFDTSKMISGTDFMKQLIDFWNREHYDDDQITFQ